MQQSSRISHCVVHIVPWLNAHQGLEMTCGKKSRVGKVLRAIAWALLDIPNAIHTCPTSLEAPRSRAKVLESPEKGH